MRKFILIAIALLLSGELLAQERFAGRIMGTVVAGVSNTPLAGVNIGVEVSEKYHPIAARTDSSGHFEINVEKLFPGFIPDQRTIYLIITKEGYDKYNKRLSCKDASVCMDIKVSLAPIAGSSALDPEESKKLYPKISSEGRTLFLLPFTITSAVGSQYSINMDNLAKAVFRAIRTHLQALPIASSSDDILPLPEVSIQPIELDVPGINVEKIRRYGLYLNALAVIVGSGNIERVESGRDMANITSYYHTIPSLPEIPSLTLDLDDTAPAEFLNTPKLYEKLTGLWGSYTLLAICLHEFRQAKAKGDRKRLETIRAYLVDEIAQLGREDQLRLREFRKLEKLVDKELQQ